MIAWCCCGSSDSFLVMIFSSSGVSKSDHNYRFRSCQFFCFWRYAPRAFRPSTSFISFFSASWLLFSCIFLRVRACVSRACVRSVICKLLFCLCFLLSPWTTVQGDTVPRQGSSRRVSEAQERSDAAEAVLFRPHARKCFPLRRSYLRSLVFSPPECRGIQGVC
jgi:hypothetical protein